MILSGKEIAAKIGKDIIIDPFDEKKINPNSYNLALHDEFPCGLLNVAGYYKKLADFLEHAVLERLIRPEHHSMILMDDNPGDLLRKFEAYNPPVVGKWRNRKT